jgi:hypothetical protein
MGCMPSMVFTFHLYSIFFLTIILDVLVPAKFFYVYYLQSQLYIYLY